MNPINKIVMEEVGLTTSDNNVVIDEESRAPVLYKGETMKYSAYRCVPVRQGEQAFDPATNQGQMAMIFEYFISKLAEDEFDPVETDIYYSVDDGSSLEIKQDGRFIKTDKYNNEQLKYVDAMRQMNNSPTDDIKKYDSKNKPRSSKKSKVDFTK